MGTIIKISRNSSQQDARKALDKLAKKTRKKPAKTLADYYGKLPGIYGDGLTYQKKIRDEWQ
jgi:hypothetical protein